MEQMLSKFGFHLIWIQLVLACVTTVTYSFLHNGKVFGDIQPQRGVLQGDPISPFLYILCVKGLSALMQRYEENNLIHGCKVARSAPSVSHLLFAMMFISFLKLLK